MTSTNKESQIINSVKEYYGKTLKSVADLKTQACIAPGKQITKHVRDAVSLVHEEVSCKYYGCGLAIPAKLEGVTVLDLGSGSGRDCYAISKLVGENGHVTGIDMTDEMITTARKYIDYHTMLFGYDKPNIDFVQGYVEDLATAGLQDNSFDIIVSNCVVNLSPDKKAVFSEAYRVLKEGGELFFSDMYCDRDIDESAREHGDLWGEGFAGALYWKDLISVSQEIGFSLPRLVSVSPIPVDRENFKKVLCDAQFCSATYRLFKLPKIEESPPLQVVYKGDITGFENKLDFDLRNQLKTDEVTNVDWQLGTILKYSRFADKFEVQPLNTNIARSIMRLKIHLKSWLLKLINVNLQPVCVVLQANEPSTECSYKCSMKLV